MSRAINAAKLVKDLTNIQPGQPWVIKDAVAFAAQKGVTAQSLWDHIPPARLRMLDPESLAIIQANSGSEPPPVANQNANPEDQDKVFAETAERLGGASLKKSWKGSDLLYWRVTDPNELLVEPVESATLQRHMASLLTEAAAAEGWVLRPAKASEMAAYLINRAPTIDHPLLLARNGEEQYCRHRPRHFPEPGECPTWRSVFDRMADGPALAAWIWGVYSGSYSGRQVPWLHGPAGQDGKSTISKVLTRELFGPTRNVISNATVKDNRFLNSFFEDSEIVLYADANNLRILQSEAFKLIAGGGADEALIEHKGRKGQLGQLRSRLFVCSNYPPSVLNEGFVVSRLLYIFIDKFEGIREAEPIINERLVSELPAFLAWARECYAERCPNDYDIQTNQQVQAAVKELIDEFDLACDILFSENWEAGSMDDKVRCSVVHELVAEAAKLDRFGNADRNSFTAYLKRKYGIERRKIGGDHYYVGLRNKGYSPAAGSAGDMGF